MKKTNAARLLDKLKIKYELHQYDVDESDLGAQNVACKIGLPLEQVFKTLVLRGDKTGVLLACIPGNKEVDTKNLAFISNNKKVEMVTLKEVLPLTGYIRGGVSPVGTKKEYPVYIDDSAKNFSVIAVSAGHRGYQLFIKPEDLCLAIKGIFAKIARKSD